MSNYARVEAFKRDLAALLERHDASIGFDCDESSDWHGITGERLVVMLGKDAFHGRATGTLTHDVWGLSSRDL